MFTQKWNIGEPTSTCSVTYFFKFVNFEKRLKVMQELQIFNNEEFGQVRTVVIDNEPYFVGKDVAIALAYKDTPDALKRHVEAEDKLTRCFTD